MQKNRIQKPALVIEYTDPEEGFQGWLVIDSMDHSLCAGGMRVQKGLSLDHLVRMASNMTCKMRICGLRVDGAKSGIDYDPAAPGKRAAMARFMHAIAPYVKHRYSMGPDLNVDMAELESVGQSLGFPSVKMAVAQAQGWDISYFKERYSVLADKVDGLPLGRIRVGFGVAVAALAVIDHLQVHVNKASVVIQGFGALAKAAAYGLDRKGVRVMAIADQEKCIISEGSNGLDIKKLLETEGPLLPRLENGSGVRMGSREEIFTLPCDVFIPAALENTITGEIAPHLQVRAVVPGANLAVTSDADGILYERGIVVLPDLLAGSGGSLSMEGLFAPEEHPQPVEILQHVEQRMSELVRQILARSRAEKISPAQAALRTCSEIVSQPGTRPYGNPGR